MADAEAGIDVEGLVRQFKTLRAVDGIDLRIRPGETYGFLGPNGWCESPVTDRAPQLGLLHEREPFHSRRKSLAWPPTTFHGESDQKKHDSNDTNDVRHPGKRTGRVAGVRPDETDNRPDDEQNDHRG